MAEQQSHADFEPALVAVLRRRTLPSSVLKDLTLCRANALGSLNSATGIYTAPTAAQKSLPQMSRDHVDVVVQMAPTSGTFLLHLFARPSADSCPRYESFLLPTAAQKSIQQMSRDHVDVVVKMATTSNQFPVPGSLWKAA